MVNIEDNPLYFAAAGGVIIGLATSLNYATRGSVTGMSGMLFRTVKLCPKEAPINLATIGGMLLISGIFFNIFGYETTSTSFTPFGPQNQITQQTSQIGFALAGLLTGIGTKLGNGCTSGHGLCGLARFSIRSLAAVLTFLSAGILIATISYYAGGLGPFTSDSFSPLMQYNHEISANICIALGIILPVLGTFLRLKSVPQASVNAVESHTASLNPSPNVIQVSSSNQNQSPLNPNQQLRNTNVSDKEDSAELKKKSCDIYKDQIVVFLVGLIFGTGLLLSGMVRRSNIIGFLALGENWNPSLMLVLSFGLTVNLIVFSYFIRVKGISLFGKELFNPQNNIVDWKLILGATLFGLGWGIGGLCPGPAIMQSSIFTVDVHLIWFPFVILGQFIADRLTRQAPAPALAPHLTPLNSNKKQDFSMVQHENTLQKIEKIDNSPKPRN